MGDRAAETRTAQTQESKENSVYLKMGFNPGRNVGISLGLAGGFAASVGSSISDKGPQK